MKFFPLLSTAILAAFMAGCATGERVGPERVSAETDPGTKRVYDTTFDETWDAILAALQRNNLEVVTTNRTIGYIQATRTRYPRELGENVEVWLRQVGTTQTEVEVLDRQIGPPTIGLVDRQLGIHNMIAANVAREAPANARVREITIDGEPRSVATASPERREATQRDIDQLRADIRSLQRRLDDLERERK